MDLFATRFNRKIPTYISPCPDPEAVGWDSLERLTNWNQWRSIYLFPPLQVLDKVVGLLSSYKGAGFLIAPFLANSELVPSFVEEMSNQVPITKKHVFVPEVFRSGVFPQQPFSFKSSRLEVIKEAVMAEGLTDFQLGF